MKELKSKKGITLIALVITIIVLLILAAVSISAIVGENGIVSKAKKAEADTIEGKEEEFVELAYSSIFLESKTEGMTEEEQIEALEKELKNLAGDDAVTVENKGDGTLIVKFTKTGKEYPVDIVKSSDVENNETPDYTQEDIDKTLEYFTFDETTGILQAKQSVIDSHPNKDIPLKIAVFPKEINGRTVTGISGWEKNWDSSGLVAYCKDLEQVIILAEIETIGDYAYYECEKLKYIELPDTLTSIGERAFMECASLTSIEIPNKVTALKFATFAYCESLTNIEIPNSVTSMSNYVFNKCTSLTSIRIPGSITSIEGYAVFRDCTALKNIIIENGVEQFYGGDLFNGCTSLTSIEIPSSVIRIGYHDFSGCTGLTSIKVDEDNPRYDSRENCNAIIETATNKLVLGCKNTTIPSNVTSIGEYAFEGCTGLTSIEIPASVTSIGNYAFSGCTGLTSIEIPASVTSIGNYAFSGCTGLTNVTIPDSVTSIGSSAFSGCTGLTSVTIPDSVTSIGNYAFSGCTGLTSVTIPSTVASIGSNAFRNVPSISYSGSATGSPWGALSVE